MSEHHENCDVNDINADGITKPCNCKASPEGSVIGRRDRSKYTLEEALHEITMAECILDGMEATKGKTLWGRIASVKARMSD